MLKIPYVFALTFFIISFENGVCKENSFKTNQLKENEFKESQAKKEQSIQASKSTSNSLEKSILQPKENTNTDYIHFLREKYPQTFSIGASVAPNSKNNIFAPEKSLEAFYDPHFFDYLDPNYDKKSSQPQSLQVYQKGFSFSDVYDGLRRFYKTYIK